MPKRCVLCRKKIEIREKECDESGYIWHCYCFRCSICSSLLNEKDVNIRGENRDQLFCKSHALYQTGRQPICKIYFNSLSYRVVF